MKKTEIKNGTKFNMLTIIREVEKINNERTFLCKCDCGNEKKIQLANLKGKTKSCGCYKKSKMKKEMTTHGLRYHRLYVSWKCMKQRCNNPKDPEYKNYGARGITICDEWEDLSKFIEDMDSTFRPGLTLDRIDNSKGYSKYNCRWSTPIEQSNNKRTNAFHKYNGKQYTIAELCRKLNVTRPALMYRIKHNKPLV